MPLVSFIVNIYHDARSPELQINQYIFIYTSYGLKVWHLFLM